MVSTSILDLGWSYFWLAEWFSMFSEIEGIGDSYFDKGAGYSSSSLLLSLKMELVILSTFYF